MGQNNRMSAEEKLEELGLSFAMDELYHQRLE
jgi:hypothetical protein